MLGARAQPRHLWVLKASICLTKSQKIRNLGPAANPLTDQIPAPQAPLSPTPWASASCSRRCGLSSSCSPPGPKGRGVRDCRTENRAHHQTRASRNVLMATLAMSYRPRIMPGAASQCDRTGGQGETQHLPIDHSSPTTALPLGTCAPLF